MNRNRLVAIAVGLAVVGGVAALIVLRHGGEAADKDSTPTADVTVAPVRSQTVSDVFTAYGVVQADPAGSVNLAAPKALIVTRVLVRVGQSVAAGQALVEAIGAPGAEQAYRQAADAVAFAQSDLARVQRLFDARLAADDQLSAAKKTLADAQSVLEAQRKQGGAGAVTLKAPQAAVVVTVVASPGDHVAQDAPLVTLARAGGAVAKLGLEPSFGRFAVGQAVTIKPSYGGADIHTQLAMVGRAADQTTKTLDAIAPLNGADLPIGAPVQGDVTAGRHQGLVIPKAAVVFDETGPHVFTLADGKAHRVFVTVGIDDGDTIEIKGGVAAGAQVAVQGAYELQDGMAAKVRGQ
jgi:RND family efflux transporter MFP subunit